MYVICLLFLQATFEESVGIKFTIKGSGEMDLNKFAIDIHLEGVNNTSTKTLPTATPTNVPTLGSRITSRATSLIKAVPPVSSHQPSPTILLTNSTSPRPTSAPTSAATSTKVTTKGRTKIVATINTGCKTTPVPEKSASVTPTTSIPSDDPSNDKEPINIPDLSSMALQLHNYYRSIHEAPPLTLDSNLEKDAQEYAENVAKNKLLRPERDFVLTSKNEGENLGFRCSITKPDPAKALRQIMKRWYDEGCKYNFKTPPSDKYSYRHFTQMTWQGSRSLGVGISYGKVNNLQCLYYVARYRPQGNLGNALLYAHNVRKGAFDSSFCKPVPSQLLAQEAVLKN